MQGVPMSDNTKIYWIKPKLELSTLRRLKSQNDLIGWAQILSETGITAVLGVIAYYGIYHWPLAASLPLLYLYFIFFSWLTREGAFHELIHGTAFSNKKVSTFLFRIINFFGWMNGDYVRAAHMRHHHVTLYEGLDMDVALDMDFLKPVEIPYMLLFHGRHFVRDLKVLTGFALGKVEGEFNNIILPAENLKERKKLYRTSRVILTLHVLLILAFVFSGQWLLILMISLGAYMATWPHLLVSMTQHVGMQKSINDWRRCARSIKVGPVTSFLYWRMQYHIEHHMYPSIPFYRLKELRKEIEFCLPERKTLWGAWKEILNYLKEYKSNPDSYIPVGQLAELP